MTSQRPATVSVRGMKSRAQLLLENLPILIRKQILRNVLLFPKGPNFEALSADEIFGLVTPRYTNFFSVAFVNKQFNQEAEEIMSSSRDFILVTTNYKGLPITLREYAIAVLSDHHTSKFKFSSMRIHLVSPCDKYNRVLSTAIILAFKLPVLATVIRRMSFANPLPQCVADIDRMGSFPLLGIQVRFGDHIHTSKDDQARLLGLLSRARFAGKVHIHRPADVALRSLLPSYPANFRPCVEYTSKELYNSAKIAWFREHRKVDAEDYLYLIDRDLELALKAFQAKNYPLAVYRYYVANRFAHNTPKAIPFVFFSQPGMEKRWDLRLFRSMLGLVNSFIASGDWMSAGRDVKLLLKKIDKRTWLPKAEVDHAHYLLRCIKQHFSNKKC
ncbi:hypothetical protein BGZ60DRAFT_200664 [Tricladium varicosporioides]|nr:hypothetical protein BGZ60DRAFT_200664 [Hymenoscyphus varicosporioides]